MWFGQPFSTRVLRSFFASGAANLGTGLITLPPWFAITCATTGRTSQVSASSLVTGLGANAARARNVGSGTGLSVENAGTNYLTYSVDLAGADWQAGAMATSTGNADPAGGTQARGFTSTGSQYGDYNQKPNVQGPASMRTHSGWCRGVTGSSPYAHWRGTTAGPSSYVDVTSTTWSRLSITEAADVPVGQGKMQANFETRANEPTGAPAISGTTSMYGYSWQHESIVLYPSSYIPTTSAAASRAADVVAVATPANVAPGGFFDLDLLVAPNYADTEQAADHNLVYFDTNNRIFIQKTTKKIVLRIGGADVLSSALTWSREAPLRIHAMHRAGGRKLDVAGATSGNGSSGLQSAASAISLPATSYLMGSNTGAEECGDLRHLMILMP